MSTLCSLGRQSRLAVMDLFAGCGGLSLGFQLTDFNIVAGVENDPTAAKSHAENFFQASDAETCGLHAVPRDILTFEPDELFDALDIAPAERRIDVIIGGPPCQAFARVGRPKLREVAEHPEAYLRDPRSNLYLRYLRYVKRLEPRAILMENVPDIINYGGHNIAEEMCEVLEDLGYVCRYTLLNAAYYGVPQMRERMFLIAYREEVRKEIEFPSPTNWIALPPGYQGSRHVALKTIRRDLFHNNSHYIDPPLPSPALPPAVTAKEALGDLPRITQHLSGKPVRGKKVMHISLPYPTIPEVSEFAMKMRSWPCFEAKDGVPDHVTRSLTRDYAIFKRMRPGDQYPEAHAVAEDLFRAKLKELRESGRAFRAGSSEYMELKRKTVPPYDPGKFPNKWRKMEPDKPARTLMAHLGKDCYSHIHYDSSQARTITVREAARLQSFPDGFIFAGSMNSAFRQIGNAVPPLMSAALAGNIKKALTKKRG